MRDIKILYEDDAIIVIVKPAGLLTIASETEREKTAYHILTDHVRGSGARRARRIFIVHRLDRDTAGVMVFAKTIEVKLFLQERWRDAEKIYVAVVHGTLRRRSGEITSYLAENKVKVVYSTRNKAIGKLSTTAYRVIAEARGMSMVEVRLLTGRKNQIRVHFSEEGHPVFGDRKYGRPEGQRNVRLALFARSLSITHPMTGERLTFTAPVPSWMDALAGCHTGQKQGNKEAKDALA